MRKRTLEMVAIAALVAAMPLTAARKKKAAAPVFSYYLLALSWAPDFCAQAGKNSDPAECGAGRKVGFVVHGLWPQGDTGRGPENCGPASPVASNLVQLMLNYIPTVSLIQHEWATHGTCSGLSAADYFAAVRKVRDSVTIPTGFKAPAQMQNLSPQAIEAAFATANPGFPKTAFRTSCTFGGNTGELQEARICFGKDLSPRACTSSAGECGSATMKVLPVR
jgi:ribonuclease T2